MRRVVGVRAATSLFIVTLAATIPMTPFKARDLGADGLGLDAGGVGTLLLLAGLANATMQAGLVGRLVPRIGALRTAMLGHGAMAVGAALLVASGALGQVWLAYLAMTLAHVPAWRRVRR